MPAKLTAAAFTNFWVQAEVDGDADRAFELDRGLVVERRPYGSEAHGLVCGCVSAVFGDYLRRLGRGYVLLGSGYLFERNPDSVFCPDAMVYTRNKQTPWTNDFATATPDLIVEVLDTQDNTAELPARAARWHTAGVPLVWVVYPEQRGVDAHRPGQPTASLEWDDPVTFPDVLPGFACTVADLFALPGTAPPTA